jgi:hypothetical protein
MKTFDLVLSKSYIVRIKAKNRHLASEFAHFFTGDISDISTKEDRRLHQFEIEDIDCKLNDVFEVIEVNEDD